MTTTSPSRYLIASLGSIGQRHLHNLRALRPDALIAALRSGATPGMEKPEACDFQFHSLDEVRAFNPEAAIIAGPASLHGEIGRALAHMGVHLFVEKPLAHDLADAQALVAAAESAGVMLMVGYNLRFAHLLTEARRQIQAGTIGEVISVRAEVGQYLPSWRPGHNYRTGVSARRELGGGALLELSHEIDFLLGMFGPPRRLYCTMGRYSGLEIDVEDLVELTMEYDDPARIVSIHLDFIQQPTVRCCKFVGTEGTLVWDAISDRIATHVAGGQAQETVGDPAADRNAMYLDEIAHFLDCVDHGSTLLIDGQQGLAVMAVIEAARRSAREGRTVELETKAHV